MSMTLLTTLPPVSQYSPSLLMAQPQPSLDQQPSSPPKPSPPPLSPPPRTIVDKTLGTTANLVRLLPGPTVLAFQTLAHPFSNGGNCHIANKYLTVFLLSLCTFSCFFSTFFDTFTFKGKLYYGVATFKGLHVLNFDDSEEEKKDLSLMNLKKYRIRILDFVHAFFSCLELLSLAFSDSDVQNCILTPNRGVNVKELLENLPLEVSFMSSLVFIIFPTPRKGIGHTDTPESAAKV